MGMTRHQVEELRSLYDKRANLQQCREYASRDFWLSVANDAFGGTGTRSSVLNALGGRGPFADLMSITVSEKFETMMREMDAEIEALGGTP